MQSDAIILDRDQLVMLAVIVCWKYQGAAGQWDASQGVGTVASNLPSWHIVGMELYIAANFIFGMMAYLELQAVGQESAKQACSHIVQIHILAFPPKQYL